MLIWIKYISCVWLNFLHILDLSFVGPCIVIYFYSKTNQMHNISNLFYFGTTLYMFRTVSPSIIGSLRLYIQYQVYVIQVLWLLGCLLASSQAATEPVWHIPDTVCKILVSRWWMERPSETCRVLFQNKINLRYCASGWFYYRNILDYFKHAMGMNCLNTLRWVKFYPVHKHSTLKTFVTVEGRLPSILNSSNWLNDLSIDHLII